MILRNKYKLINHVSPANLTYIPSGPDHQDTAGLNDVCLSLFPLSSPYDNGLGISGVFGRWSQKQSEGVEARGRKEKGQHPVC